MELDAVTKPRILAAALQLSHGVVFERVEAAKGAQPVWILARLGGIPVVFGANLGILVIHRPLGTAIDVGSREQERLPDPGRIEQRDHVASSNRLDLLRAARRKQCGHLRAEQVLMVVGDGSALAWRGS